MVLIISLEEDIIHILDQIILCCGDCPVHCRMFHSISGLYLLYAHVIPPPAMTIKYVSSKQLLGRKLIPG